MDKTTHAKIEINDAGETEVRSLDVVRESEPGQRHSLVNIDVSQAVGRIEDEARLPAATLSRPASASFLAELTERARRYGWSGDYSEVTGFVEALYLEAGIDPPNLDPYHDDEVPSQGVSVSQPPKRPA